MPRVDVNADVGESFGRWTIGDDDGVLAAVTSVSIACGFHAGDPTVMRRLTRSAAMAGVSIGAHVGYRDLFGFGRRPQVVDPSVLRDEVLYQLAALDGFARAAGARVSYVKPHGALYNAMVHDEEQAMAAASALAEFDPSLVALGLPESAWLRVAEAARLATATESFPDRAYTSEGTLVSRQVQGAVLSDVREIARRATAMALGEQIEDIDGKPLRIAPDSVCIHGDSPEAGNTARIVCHALESAGVKIAPFASA